MAGVNVSVDATEVEEKLRKMRETGLDNAGEKATQKACLIVEKDAKKLCPVDTGNLRNSITHEVKNEGSEVAGYVLTNVDYAPYIHEGTGIYTSGGRTQVPWTFKGSDGEWHQTSGTKPNPFMKKALEQDQRQILECFKDVAKDALQ